VPALAAALSLASAAAAFAAQTSFGVQARVSIQTSCLIAVGDLDFGNVGTIFGGETAAATVGVNCSQGTPYTLSFSASSPVTAYNGQMINGAWNVAYSAALSAAGGTGPGTHTIFGLLPPQTTPVSAIYTDNRTVYLTY
jgi:spore coat protein U-like protein